MISDASRGKPSLVPFLFRFAQPLPDVPNHVLRYDTMRQVSQVLIHGFWIDSPDAPGEPPGLTRQTRIQAETTDDV